MQISLRDMRAFRQTISQRIKDYSDVLNFNFLSSKANFHA